MKIVTTGSEVRYTLAKHTLTNIHDGYLMGMSLTSNNQLELELKCLSGERAKLVFPDLLTLVANDFRQGNIIDDINFYSSEESPWDLVLQAYGIQEAEKQKSLPIYQRILDPYNWTLLELASSYGCELLALSKSSIENIVILPIE